MYYSGLPPIFEYISYLNSKNILLYTICIYTAFTFFDTFWNFVYEVTDALHKSFFL
jgi:hypothetical protein